MVWRIRDTTPWWYLSTPPKLKQRQICHVGLEAKFDSNSPCCFKLIMRETWWKSRLVLLPLINVNFTKKVTRPETEHRGTALQRGQSRDCSPLRPRDTVTISVSHRKKCCHPPSIHHITSHAVKKLSDEARQGLGGLPSTTNDDWAPDSSHGWCWWL